MKALEASGDSSNPHMREQKHNGAISAKSRRIIDILLLTLLLLLLAVACEPPRPKCPAIPRVQRDFGDPAKRSGAWHVEIDLRGLFVDKYVRALLDQSKESKPGDSPTPTPTPGPKFGQDYNRVWLEERGTGPDRMNLIAVNFSVWSEYPPGENRYYWPERTYTLWLRFVPYLITQDTVPDKDKRWAILGCKSELDCGKREWDSATNGIVLALDFYQLTGGSGRGPNDPVDCRGYPYDRFYNLFDEQVLTEALKIAATQKPIKLPVDRIVMLVDNLVVPKEENDPPTPPVVRLAGLDLGTDQHLEIGLDFEVEPNSSVSITNPTTFDSCCSELSRHSGMDWGLNIDKPLVRQFIQKTVEGKVKQKVSDAIINDDDVKVDFTSDGLTVDADFIVPLPVCGDVPVSLKFPPIKMDVCTKDMKPNQRTCQAPFKQIIHGVCGKVADSLATLGGDIKSIIRSIFTGGEAVVTVTCSSDYECSLNNEIRIPLSEDVIYDHQKGVTLYGTQIDTDNKFFIGGVAGSNDSYIPLPSCDLCPGGTETVPDGTLNLDVRLLPATDSGRFQIVLDGNPFGNPVGGYTTHININLRPGLHTVELTPSGGTVKTDYIFEFRTGCNQDPNVKDPVGFVTLHPGKEIICDVTVRNKNAPAILTIRTVLLPDNDAGRFDIGLDGVVRLSQAGNASTGPMRMSLGSHTVTLIASAGTDITKYKTDICFGGTIWLAPGDDITCTIRNTLIKEPNPVELCRGECQEEYKSCLAESTTSNALTKEQCREAFDSCTDACQIP